MNDQRLEKATADIRHYYGDRLVGVALFGSRTGRRARSDSDWDLVLVLDETDPVRRSLYREWDAEVAPIVDSILREIAPHFVHLPSATDEPSGFWLEIAMAHVVLHDPHGLLAAHLGRARALVEDGRYEGRDVHGIRYWRKIA